MADGIFVDTHQLSELAADLIRTSEGVAVAVAGELAANASALAGVARDIAGSYQSSAQGGSQGGTASVVESIHVRPVSRSEFRVEAGGPGVPLAGLWELGNKGSSPNSPTFRHPTYGRLPYVDQQKWPFLRMALRQYEPIALSRLGRFFDNMLRRNRL